MSRAAASGGALEDTDSESVGNAVQGRREPESHPTDRGRGEGGSVC